MVVAPKDWFRKHGGIALAIMGDENEGWRIRLKIGRREADFETRFTRLRDAERAAVAIWVKLQSAFPRFLGMDKPHRKIDRYNLTMPL